MYQCMVATIVEEHAYMQADNNRMPYIFSMDLFLCFSALSLYIYLYIEREVGLTTQMARFVAPAVAGA